MAKTEWTLLRESQTTGNMGECTECGMIYNLYRSCPFCAEQTRMAALSNEDVLNILFFELQGEEEARAQICSGALLTKRSTNVGTWTRHGLVADPAAASGIVHDFLANNSTKTKIAP